MKPFLAFYQRFDGAEIPPVVVFAVSRRAAALTAEMRVLGVVGVVRVAPLQGAKIKFRDRGRQRQGIVQAVPTDGLALAILANNGAGYTTPETIEVGQVVSVVGEDVPRGTSQEINKLPKG